LKKHLITLQDLLLNKADYTLWKTLQTLLIISHEILGRNISLYFMRKFTETSDYTLWHNLDKHVIILHEQFVQKLLCITYESLWTYRKIFL